MTLDEVVDLLTLIAARDNRNVGQGNVLAWHQDVGDLDFADCAEAVSRHFRESTEWLMPAHIRDHVRAIRDQRLAGVDRLLPDGDPDDEEAYRQGLARIRQRIGAGVPLPGRAIEATPAEPTEPYRQTRDELAERRKTQALAAARDTDPIAAPCGCGASLDRDGNCRSCKRREATR